MSIKKKSAEGETPSKKTELSVAKKPTAIKSQKKPATLATPTPQDLYEAFDDTFERFRTDFEDLLFPSTWANSSSNDGSGR
jgi:hypothetical protein